MADITIAAANVQLVSGPVEHYIAGQGLIPGQIASAVQTNGRVSQGSNATEALHDILGMALNRAEVGQPIAVARNGAVVTVGAVLTEGETYVLSTAGLISPVGDKATNDWLTHVGYARTTSQLVLNIIVTGEQVA